MKIIFLSSSDIALRTFENLVKHHEIAAVITQPDSIRGRSGKKRPSPIAENCENKEHIKLYKPDIIDNKLIKELKELKADLFITFSFGVILKKEFLSICKYGGINIHPSLLPDLRGPSPIQTAILRGSAESGITVQFIELAVDSGDIIYQEKFKINENDDAITLEDKVSKISAGIILNVLNLFKDNKIERIKQDNTKATYCYLFKKEDGLINWNNSSKDIINKIRACVKWPVAYSFINNKMRINIYKAKVNNEIDIKSFSDTDNGRIIFADKKNGIVVKVSDGAINLEKLQKAGKKVLDWKSFINGFNDLDKMNFSME